MSRPLKQLKVEDGPLTERMKKRRQVGLDESTYRKLRSIADMISNELGTNLHLNQIIQILIRNYIQKNYAEKEKKDLLS